jgi:nitrate/TMAO reductase-like tetraheme cytochrome c subunit
MNNAAKAKLLVLVCAFALTITSVIQAKHSVSSQQPPQGEPKQGEQKSPPPAGQHGPQELKNIQVFKGLTRPQLIQEMGKFNKALGVECSYCHVRPFDADTARKSTARLMVRDYTMGMKHKDGSALSCNDCHMGQPNFLRTRAFEGAVGKKMEGLQVLKGMPRERLMQVMNSFTKALGVECSYCHTDDFDEETPRKQLARFMMTEFTGKLAKQDGSAVTCNDCHQGHAHALTHLPFARREEPKPPAKPEEKKPDEKKLN